MSRENYCKNIKSGFAQARFELNPLDGGLSVGWFSSSWSKFELTIIFSFYVMPRPQSCVVDPDLNLGRQKWPKKKAKLWIRICIDFFGWIRFQLAKITTKEERRRIVFFFLFSWLDAVVRIRNVYPGSKFFPSRIQGWQDPGSGSASFSIFNLKNGY